MLITTTLAPTYALCGDTSHAIPGAEVDPGSPPLSCLLLVCHSTNPGAFLPWHLELFGTSKPDRKGPFGGGIRAQS